MTTNENFRVFIGKVHQLSRCLVLAGIASSGQLWVHLGEVSSRLANTVEVMANIIFCHGQVVWETKSRESFGKVGQGLNLSR